MVLTDTYQLIVDRKEAVSMTWQEIGERSGIGYAQNVIDAARRGTLAPSFVKVADALDCDIEIILKPRPTDPKEFVWRVSKGRRKK